MKRQRKRDVIQEQEEGREDEITKEGQRNKEGKGEGERLEVERKR